MSLLILPMISHLCFSTPAVIFTVVMATEPAKRTANVSHSVLGQLSSSTKCDGTGYSELVNFSELGSAEVSR